MGTVGLACFYCDISDAKKRGKLWISLAHLLFTSLYQEHQISQSVLEKTYKDCIGEFSTPSNDQLHGVLIQLISGFEMVYILTDVLDECLKVAYDILEFIETLQAWDLRQSHLLVTSREEQQIIQSIMLTKSIQIDMYQIPVDDDIPVANCINDLCNSE